MVILMYQLIYGIQVTLYTINITILLLLITWAITGVIIQVQMQTMTVSVTLLTILVQEYGIYIH